MTHVYRTRTRAIRSKRRSNPRAPFRCCCSLAYRNTAQKRKTGKRVSNHTPSKSKGGEKGTQTNISRRRNRYKWVPLTRESARQTGELEVIDNTTRENAHKHTRHYYLYALGSLSQKRRCTFHRPTLPLRSRLFPHAATTTALLVLGVVAVHRVELQQGRLLFLRGSSRTAGRGGETVDACDARTESTESNLEKRKRSLVHHKGETSSERHRFADSWRTTARQSSNKGSVQFAWPITRGQPRDNKTAATACNFGMGVSREPQPPQAAGSSCSSLRQTCRKRPFMRLVRRVNRNESEGGARKEKQVLRPAACSSSSQPHLLPLSVAARALSLSTTSTFRRHE